MRFVLVLFLALNFVLLTHARAEDSGQADLSSTSGNWSNKDNIANDRMQIDDDEMSDFVDQFFVDDPAVEAPVQLSQDPNSVTH